eukprot:1658480-Amphidinium_carterae.1
MGPLASSIFWNAQLVGMSVGAVACCAFLASTIQPCGPLEKRRRRQFAPRHFEEKLLKPSVSPHVIC